MAKRIAFFNHKGGVSKTTTTFNLGWMLAEKGHTVVMVDADPQCNLTGMVLGYRGPSELEHFYQTEADRNIRAGLAPAFESRPKLIEPTDCVPVRGQDRLFLLPGQIRLAEYEVTLGFAQELSATIQTLQNLPGALSFLLKKTAAKFNASYVLVDMSPSLGSINQNLLMTSDFFIVPTSPDYFSVMAIESLASVIPNWFRWAEKAGSLQILQEASYPFPRVTPRFLGTIVQKFRPRGGEPAAAFQQWIDEITKAVTNGFVPVLRKLGMMLPEYAYIDQHMANDFCLASIPDFNSLIALSQEAQIPVFALTREQVGQSGVVWETTMRSRDRFRQIFSELADKVVALTSYASSD